MGALKLTACMKVVAKMGEMDQESLLDRLDRYTADGVPKDRAQVMAASDTLAELIDERREFMVMLREQHPDLFRVTNAIPEDQDVNPEQPDADDSSIRRSTGRSEEEIAAARVDGWTIADNDLPSREAAERIVKLRTKGNSVVKPMAAWQDAEVRVVESDNPGFWAIETRKAGIKRSSARDITDTPEFKRWFGDSKVVDADGKPLVVYHGTAADFSEFKLSESGAYGGGVYLTNDRRMASGYGEATGGNVMPVYASIKNPYRVDASLTGDARHEQRKAFMRKGARERLMEEGYDGVIVTDGSYQTIVAFRPEQIKSAIGNNGQFDPENPDITRSPARNEMGFYSALAKGVEDMQTKAAPAGAWKTQIKGLVNKGQVKQDEIEWSGIEDFLDLQQGKVSKDQVLEYLRGNGVQVEEVVLGQPSEADIEMLLNDEAGEGMSREDVIEYLSNDEGATPPKYDRYTLPGGENYREVLLTLPPIGAVKYTNENVIAIDDSNDPDRSKYFWRFKVPGNELQISRQVYRTQEEAKAYILKEKQPEPPADKNYQSSHWGQKNVLAHIRVNDRTDPDGKRVLFVEEVQSDFQQDYRKSKSAIKKAVESDFAAIVERMKKAGVLEVVCD